MALFTLADRRAKKLISTPHSFWNPDLSPDGRWLAYNSNETGRNEVYVHPFPDVDSGRRRVSGQGGYDPVWSRDGRELFFLQNVSGSVKRLMVAQVREGGREIGTPQALFEGHYYVAVGRSYDASLDGQRFLMIKVNPSAEALAAPSAFVAVLNWAAGLQNRD